MLRNHIAVVKAVRDDLHDMEAAADNAAVALLTGIANIILQRRQAGLSFDTGSESLVRLSDAAAAQLRANLTLAEAHREMAKLPAKIDARAFGDVEPCEPDEEKRRYNGADLRAVTA